MTLDELVRGVEARISGFSEDAKDNRIVAKLREIGFAEGDEVELMHRGLIGGTPLSFRLNRTLIALRKREAKLIYIDEIAGGDVAR